MSSGRLVAVADHGAEQTLVARGWRAHKPAQLEGVRDVALDKEQDWRRKDFRQHRSRTYDLRRQETQKENSRYEMSEVTETEFKT